MRVISPISVTDSVLTASSISERDTAVDPPAWVSGTTYTNGDVVCVVSSHKQYTYIGPSGVASTISPHVSVTLAQPHWAESGVTNKWAMFDLFRNTPSIFPATTGTFTLVPGQAVNSISFLGISGTDILEVECTYFNGSIDVVFYTFTIDLITRTVTSWYEYFFEPFVQQQTLIIQDIPTTYSNMKINVTITGSAGMEIGSCVVGNSSNMGWLTLGSQSELLNFSKLDRDAFGSALLVPRRSVPRLTGEVVFPKSMLANNIAIKKALDAKAALWLGLDDEVNNPYFEPTIILGVYKEMTFSLDNPLFPRMSFELEEV